MKKNRKIISILFVILLILIIFAILKIKFYNVNGDLVVIRNINYNVGDLICAEENYKYKITRITGEIENKYITKIDGSLYNDQIQLSKNEIKGVYQFRINYILGILTSKITWTIILIILISIVIYINRVEKRKKLRKIKKEEVS